MLIGGVARRAGCVAGRAGEKLRQRGAEKEERQAGLGASDAGTFGAPEVGNSARRYGAGEGNRVFQGKASEVGNELRRSATRCPLWV